MMSFADLLKVNSIAKNTKDGLAVSFARTSQAVQSLAKTIPQFVLTQFVRIKNKAHRNCNSYTPKEKIS